jgi:hypothetical protein
MFMELSCVGIVSLLRTARIFGDASDDHITLTAATAGDDVQGRNGQAHVNRVAAATTRLGTRFRAPELELLHGISDFVAPIAAGRAGA